MLFYHFSKVKVLKLIIKIIIGVLLSSLLSAKFTRWSSSIAWKNLQQGLFSSIQFGFKGEVGCTKASFTILESINHTLERGSKVFGCFLDVRKAFDTVWTDGLLFELFSEFGVKGRMWLVIRNLYIGVKAQVLYSGSLSRKFDILQGQGRIPALFMYKVYINGLLNDLHSTHVLYLLIVSV